MELKGSKTEQNLMTAFAGESQARNKYTYYASQARKEGYEYIAEVLEKISNKLPNYPLVLHGASTVIPEFVDKCNEYGADIPGAQGVPEDLLRKAASMGVAKINVDTDLRLGFVAGVREFLENNKANINPRDFLTNAKMHMTKIVVSRMKNLVK